MLDSTVYLKSLVKHIKLNAGYGLIELIDSLQVLRQGLMRAEMVRARVHCKLFLFDDVHLGADKSFELLNERAVQDLRFIKHVKYLHHFL
jgi:hypothetical protein